jgi:hypothetical protein
MMYDAMKKILSTGLILGGAVAAFADQPVPSGTVTNSPCQDGPKMVGGQPDTVAAAPDAEGFVSIFNGNDLTGWWEDCQTHTTDTKLGGVWWVDPVQHLLFSREEGQNGDILVTNKKYENYEIVLDLWPVFGNDGGVFNRVTNSGSCWQSTIDYIQGSSVGGSFNEKSWMPGTNLNDDPFLYGGSPANPSVTTWTTFTKDLNPTSFGCSAGGCVSADFAKVWDVAGWNQFRVKFYDGLTAGRSVTMENFIRKLGAENWVPTYKKTEPRVTPAGPIALQIHGAGRLKAGTYNVYRNIKVRPLNIDGTPVPVVTSTSRSGYSYYNLQGLKIAGGMITGTLETAYEITLTDVSGKMVERFHGEAGHLQHAVPASAQGVIIAELRNGRGIQRIRLNRI